MDLAQKVTSMHRLGAETRELYQVRDGSWEARVFCRANDDTRVGAGATPADALDHAYEQLATLFASRKSLQTTQ